MTILVTRPSPAGEQLVNRLCQRGLVAYHAPLIQFSPGRDLPKLPHYLQALQAGDLLFVLSQHAIHYAAPLLARQQFPWPRHLVYYAIGRTSALALHQVSSLSVDYPQGREISEMLLQLPALQQVSGRKALLLRGNGGRALLADTLRERGAEPIDCECYQRSPLDYEGHEQAALWQQLQVDTLVVTSGEMLQQLYRLIPEYYRDIWLLRCRLIVVSERLAALARQLGWQRIRVADNADNDALVRALQST